MNFIDSGILLDHVSRVVEQYFAAQRGIVEMGVDLRGADVGVAQERLNDPQVGAAAQQCGGKRVAQGVWRDGLGNARGLALPLDHDENHGAGEMMPAAVEKHEVFFARLDDHLPAVVKPQFKLVDGAVGDGHESLLVALADDADEFLVEKEV